MKEFILEIPVKNKIDTARELFVKEPEIQLNHYETDFEFLVWGDKIAGKDFQQRLSLNRSPEFVVRNLYGHYYYVLINKTTQGIIVGNSLFSILPLYYHYGKDTITVSDNSIILARHLNKKLINNRFILETLLFNYPLFNESIFKDIYLVPSNSYLCISRGSYSVRRHTETADLFECNPMSIRHSLKFMPDVFLETVSKYLPEEKYACSLTGGFDGRALASSGLFHKREFSAYAFGSETAKDVIIAEKLSRVAGLRFNRINLGVDYAARESLECGREFIFNSSGTATFARAHYLFAAKKLAEETKYIVTGNFGSEIFRSAHISGAMISGNLYNIFISDTPEQAFRKIEISQEYLMINKHFFRNEWKELIDDLRGLPCFDKKFSRLSKNQKFYLILIEEVFRKYFGSEMVGQFKYLKNRTPFLDIDFLETMLKSKLAGAHSDFFEHNPLMRHKGQLLYAHIIKKAYPDFGRIMTDKGYSPDDLLSLSGKLRLTIGYLERKMFSRAVDNDPNYVIRAWKMNKDIWKNNQGMDNLLHYENIKSNEGMIRARSLAYLLTLCQEDTTR